MATDPRRVTLTPRALEALAELRAMEDGLRGGLIVSEAIITYVSVRRAQIAGGGVYVQAVPGARAERLMPARMGRTVGAAPR